ncbi:hypothetical protein FRC03_010514 [Tulasnella sp. 419]|nr:hypothetical protein FRC03_010514 [Tulasnella sp. 419]
MPVTLQRQETLVFGDRHFESSTSTKALRRSHSFYDSAAAERPTKKLRTASSTTKPSSKQLFKFPAPPTTTTAPATPVITRLGSPVDLPSSPSSGSAFSDDLSSMDMDSPQNGEGDEDYDKVIWAPTLSYSTPQKHYTFWDKCENDRLYFTGELHLPQTHVTLASHRHLVFSHFDLEIKSDGRQGRYSRENIWSPSYIDFSTSPFQPYPIPQPSPVRRVVNGLRIGVDSRGMADLDFSFSSRSVPRPRTIGKSIRPTTPPNSLPTEQKFLPNPPSALNRTRTATNIEWKEAVRTPATSTRQRRASLSDPTDHQSDSITQGFQIGIPATLFQKMRTRQFRVFARAVFLGRHTLGGQERVGKVWATEVVEAEAGSVTLTHLSSAEEMGHSIGNSSTLSRRGGTGRGVDDGLGFGGEALARRALGSVGNVRGGLGAGAGGVRGGATRCGAAIGPYGTGLTRNPLLRCW